MSGPIRPRTIHRLQSPRAQLPRRMPIFGRVNLFAPRGHRDEAKSFENLTPKVEIDARHDEIALRCDQLRKVSQACFRTFGGHMRKEVVRKDEVVLAESRDEIR